MERRHMSKWLNTILIIFLFHQSAICGGKKITIDSLTVKRGQLRLFYHVDGLFDSKIQKGLQKGFTSEIVHHIFLWKSKKVISSIVNELVHPVKVYYDDWQNKYAVATATENRLTANIETVDEMCSYVKALSICDTLQLEVGSKYYISIEVKIQPISNETYQELSNWISGSSEKNKAKESQNPKKGRLTTMLIDMMGLGDKTLVWKSKDFEISSSHRIEFLE